MNNVNQLDPVVIYRKVLLTRAEGVFLSSIHRLFVYHIMGASLVAQPVKNPPAMQEDLGSILGLGRSPGEGNGYPLQYSGLENSRDYIVVHGFAESDMTKQLSPLHHIMSH